MLQKNSKPLGQLELPPPLPLEAKLAAAEEAEALATSAGSELANMITPIISST